MIPHAAMRLLVLVQQIVTALSSLAFSSLSFPSIWMDNHSIDGRVVKVIIVSNGGEIQLFSCIVEFLNR
jgi:hypothetical protein